MPARSALTFAFPFIQVVMIVMTMAAMRSGSQPPLTIFVTLPAKKTTSSATKVQTASAIFSGPTFQTHAARQRNRNDSSSRVPVTAKPYAAARCSELWKTATSATTPKNRIQLMEPM